MGSVACLNVSGGDIKIEFDKDNVAETIRAKRMITDMLKRGYALLIETENGAYTRCLEFKEDVGVYVVADFDPAEDHTKKDDKDESIEPKQTVDDHSTASGVAAETTSGPAGSSTVESDAPAAGKRGPGRPRGKTKEVKMESATARAVPRTSGG